MPFWSALLQGVWLGAVAWAGFHPSYGKGIALMVVPFIALYATSGNFLASLLFGWIGLGIVIVVWGIIREFRKIAARRACAP